MNDLLSNFYETAIYCYISSTRSIIAPFLTLEHLLRKPTIKFKLGRITDYSRLAKQ